MMARHVCRAHSICLLGPCASLDHQSRNNPVALKAYHKVIKLSPDSAEATQARQQIQYLKSQQPSG